MTDSSEYDGDYTTQLVMPQETMPKMEPAANTYMPSYHLSNPPWMCGVYAAPLYLPAHSHSPQYVLVSTRVNVLPIVAGHHRTPRKRHGDLVREDVTALPFNQEAFALVNPQVLGKGTGQNLQVNTTPRSLVLFSTTCARMSTQHCKIVQKMWSEYGIEYLGHSGDLRHRSSTSAQLTASSSAHLGLPEKVSRMISPTRRVQKGTSRHVTRVPAF